MSSSTLNQLALRAARQTIRLTTRQSSSLMPSSVISAFRFPPLVNSYQGTSGLRSSQVLPRSFSTTRSTNKGLSPLSEDPPAPISATDPSTESTEYNVGGVPAEITVEQYNELSDDYMNALVEKLEQLQEEKEEVDVEYSAGVLTLTFPPNGTYVINKQPPNKQIWLSSPITGPKRYDYVITSEGQDAKEGTGDGEWVYLRDGSTLSALLEKEIGVDMSESYAPEPQLND